MPHHPPSAGGCDRAGEKNDGGKLGWTSLKPSRKSLERNCKRRAFHWLGFSLGYLRLSNLERQDANPVPEEVTCALGPASRRPTRPRRQGDARLVPGLPRGF